MPLPQTTPTEPSASWATATTYCTPFGAPASDEFYDVARDPSQMRNYFDPTYTGTQAHYALLGRSFAHVADGLYGLLMITKACKGRTCALPWRTLPPSLGVDSLADVLGEEFHGLHQRQPKVAFSSCVKGHVVAEEGPQDVPWKKNELLEWGPGLTKGSQGPLLSGTKRRASLERPRRWSDWTKHVKRFNPRSMSSSRILRRCLTTRLNSPYVPAPTCKLPVPLQRFQVLGPQAQRDCYFTAQGPRHHVRQAFPALKRRPPYSLCSAKNSAEVEVVARFFRP